MTKIYQFPQGQDRDKYKSAVSEIKRHRALKKSGGVALKGVEWLWFAVRLIAANGIHAVTAIGLGLLGAFSTFIFFLGGIGCVIVYYHLDKHFYAPNNYTIPFIVGLWILSCTGGAIADYINENIPFHRLFCVLKKEDVYPDKQRTASDESH